MALVAQEESDKLLSEINFIKKDSGGSVANNLPQFLCLEVTLYFCGKVKNDDLGKVFVQSMEKLEQNFYVKWQILDYQQLDVL